MIVCRQPSLTERQLKLALADICDLRDNVYHCIDVTSCCKVSTHLASSLSHSAPCWVRASPFPPCSFSSSSFALFLLFPFFSGFHYFLCVWWDVKPCSISLWVIEGQRHMLQRVLHRASSRGFTPYYYDLDTLAENAHYHLFRHCCCQAHCLNHLYTVKPRPPGAMQLRTRGHQFELPALKYEFNKRNFIVRSLFNYV